MKTRTIEAHLTPATRMTLERAILLIGWPKADHQQATFKDYAAASKLSVKAMQRLKLARDKHQALNLDRLPNETID